VAAAFCVPANNRMDEIVDNIAMHRFEMPIGDDSASPAKASDRAWRTPSSRR
jgi:hypothetical protein